jgi:hypothetical protein
MRCFYSNLDCLGIIEKTCERKYVRPYWRSRWLPVRNEHNFDNIGRPVFHVYPDLRKQFACLPLIPLLDLSTKPLLVIHNKHNDEWASGPVNHIPLATLETMFKTLSDVYTIVYIRHGMGMTHSDFSDDHNEKLPFDETQLLSRYPRVRSFDSLYEEHRRYGGSQDLNTFKNVLYSRCYRFISSQGGGAHHIALYSGSLLLLLHRHGFEEFWAYSDGYYGFMADVPPIRAVCRSDEDLVSALCLFDDSEIVDRRILVDARNAAVLERLSPWTIADRRDLNGSRHSTRTPSLAIYESWGPKFTRSQTAPEAAPRKAK